MRTKKFAENKDVFLENIDLIQDFFDNDPEFRLEEGAVRFELRIFATATQSFGEPTNDILRNGRLLVEKIYNLEDDQDESYKKGLFMVYRALVHYYLSKHLEGGDKSEIKAEIILSTETLKEGLEQLSGNSFPDLLGHMKDINKVMAGYERSDSVPSVLISVSKMTIAIIRNSIEQLTLHSGKWLLANDKWYSLIDVLQENPIVKEVLRNEILDIKTNINKIISQHSSLGDNSAFANDSWEKVKSIASAIIDCDAEISDIVIEFCANCPKNEEGELIISPDSVSSEMSMDFYANLVNYFSKLFENRIYLIQKYLSRNRNVSTQDAIQFFEKFTDDLSNLEEVVSEKMDSIVPGISSFLNQEMLRGLVQGLKIDYEEQITILKFRLQRMQLEDSMPFEELREQRHKQGDDRSFSFERVDIDDEITLNTIISNLKAEIETALSYQKYQYAIELFKNYSRALGLKIKTTYEELCSHRITNLSENVRQQKFLDYLKLVISATEEHKHFRHKLHGNYNTFDKAHLLYSRSYIQDHIFQMKYRFEFLKIYNYDPRLALGMGVKGVFTYLDDDPNEEERNNNRALIREIIKYIDSPDAYSEDSELPDKYQKYISAVDRIDTDYNDEQGNDVLVDTLRNPYTKTLRLLRETLINAFSIIDNSFCEQVIGRIALLVENAASMDKEYALLHDSPLLNIGMPDFYSIVDGKPIIDMKMLMHDENIATNNDLLLRLFRTEKPIEIQHSDRSITIKAEWQSIFEPLKNIIISLKALDVVTPENLHNLLSDVSNKQYEEVLNDFDFRPMLTELELDQLRNGKSVKKTTILSANDNIGMGNTKYNNFYFVPQFLSIGDEENGNPYVMVYVSHEPISTNEMDFIEGQDFVFRMIIESINERIDFLNRTFENPELTEIISIVRGDILSTLSPKSQRSRSQAYKSTKFTLEQLENILFSIDQHDFDDRETRMAYHKAMQELKITKERFGKKSLDILHAITEQYDEHTETHSFLVYKIVLDILDTIDMRKFFASDDDYNKYVEMVKVAAIHHDLGKLRIDPSILNKSRRLGYLEREAIPVHLSVGVEICESLLPYEGEESRIHVIEPESIPSDASFFMRGIYKIKRTVYRKTTSDKIEVDNLSDERNGILEGGVVNIRMAKLDVSDNSSSSITQIDLLGEKSYKETEKTSVVKMIGSTRSEAIVSALESYFEPHIITKEYRGETMKSAVRDCRCKYSVISTEVRESGDVQVEVKITQVEKVSITSMSPSQIIHAHHTPPHLYVEKIGHNFMFDAIANAACILTVADIEEALTSNYRSYREAVSEEYFGSLVAKNPNILESLKTRLKPYEEISYKKIKLHHIRQGLRRMLDSETEFIYGKYPRLLKLNHQKSRLLSKIFDRLMEEMDKTGDTECVDRMPEDIRQLATSCSKLPDYIDGKYEGNISSPIEEILLTKFLFEVVKDLLGEEETDTFQSEIDEVSQYEYTIRRTLLLIEKMKYKLIKIRKGKFKLMDDLDELLSKGNKTEHDLSRIKRLKQAIVNLSEKITIISSELQASKERSHMIIKPLLDDNKTIRNRLWKQISPQIRKAADALVKWEYGDIIISEQDSEVNE